MRTKDFPHEIGLFLGYPLEDVQGFIENRAEGYKCVGCWKVYGDEEYAKQEFRAIKIVQIVIVRCGGRERPSKILPCPVSIKNIKLNQLHSFKIGRIDV